MPFLPSYRNQSIDLHSKSIDWFVFEGNIGKMFQKKRKAPVPKSLYKERFIRCFSVNFANFLTTPFLQNTFIIKYIKRDFITILKWLKYLPRFLKKMAHRKNLIKTVTFQGLLHLSLVNGVASKSSVIFI